MMRLNKFIAESGLCSRRAADRLIETGEVRVNGKPVTTLGVQINPDTDHVDVSGQRLRSQFKHYLLFHKPAGVITTRSDEKGRKTIYDVMPRKYHACDPAGRLDRESSGAMILSNDGDFIHHVTHPQFHWEKVYRVTVDRAFLEPDRKALLVGILLLPENKLAQATSAELETHKILTISLVTGYNRQIRRMLEHLGYEIKKLKRMAIGPVRLGSLKPGQVRLLRREELRILTGEGSKGSNRLKGSKKRTGE